METDLNKLKQTVAETLNCDLNQVTIEDGEAYSPAAVELSMALEEGFHVTIEDGALPDGKTVGGMA